MWPLTIQQKQEILDSIVSRDSVTCGFCCVCLYVLVVVVGGGGGCPHTYTYTTDFLGSELRSVQICLDLIFPLYWGEGVSTYIHTHDRFFWVEFRSVQICLDLISLYMGRGGGSIYIHTQLWSTWMWLDLIFPLQWGGSLIFINLYSNTRLIRLVAIFLSRARLKTFNVQFKSFLP